MSNAKGIIKCRKIYGMRITAAKVRHEKSVQAAIRSRLSRNISIQRHLNLSVLPLRCSPKSKKAEMFLTVQGEKAPRTAENLPRRNPGTDLIIILSAEKRDT